MPEREPPFGVSRLREAFAVYAGPDHLGVVLRITLTEASAQALADELNRVFEAHPEETRP